MEVIHDVKEGNEKFEVINLQFFQVTVNAQSKGKAELDKMVKVADNVGKNSIGNFQSAKFGYREGGEGGRGRERGDGKGVEVCHLIPFNLCLIQRYIAVI